MSKADIVIPIAVIVIFCDSRQCYRLLAAGALQECQCQAGKEDRRGKGSAVKRMWYDIASTVLASVKISAMTGLVMGLVMGLVAFRFFSVDPEIECKKYVGSAYVYDNGECYRLLEDGTLHRVNVRLEKKIEEARERGRE